jgi:hypothetical protein
MKTLRKNAIIGVSKESINEVASYLKANDMETVAKIVASGRIEMTDTSNSVYISSCSLWDNTCKIRFEGETTYIWTLEHYLK